MPFVRFELSYTNSLSFFRDCSHGTLRRMKQQNKHPLYYSYVFFQFTTACVVRDVYETSHQHLQCYGDVGRICFGAPVKCLADNKVEFAKKHQDMC